MQFLLLVSLQILPCLYHLSKAATVPRPATLPSAAAPGAIFNLSSYHHGNTSLSALPPLPFHYGIPGLELSLVFTSFDAVLADADVFSIFIDATSFAIDGMVHDGTQPITFDAPLRWHQGGAELFIIGNRKLTYNILATALAAVHDVGMTYGIHATLFEIWAANTRIGTGQMSSRRAQPGLASPTTSNGTATARRDLSLPPDPYIMHVGNTPIVLRFGLYKGALPTPYILDCLVTAIFNAASAIRDSRGDVLIRRPWLWERAARLSLEPRPEMSFRNLATAVVGMKHFVLAEGGSLDFRYEVYLRENPPLRIGSGRMGVMQ